MVKVMRGGRRVAPPPGPREPHRWRYPYEPFPKQAQAHGVWADELLFGGAAGPGKTDWLLAEVILTLLELGQRLPPTSARPTGVIFRRTFPELARPRGIIQRLIERIPHHVATYNAGEHVWTFRNGAKLLLSHLQYEGDVQDHQGAEYDIIGWDQLEQFTEFQYRFMSQRLRSAGELAERMRELGYRPRMVATANPGGPGHAWVKARWIDPAPSYVVWQPEPTDDEPDPGTRAFVPGKHTDNPALEESYRQRLRNLPPDERRALEEGDWDVFVGQRFKHFRRDIHVVKPEDYPIPLAGVPKAVGVDYGLEAPFVALWGAKVGELIVVYRELDGRGLTPDQQAAAILEAEVPGERRQGRNVPVALDPSTWARQPGHPAPPSEKSGAIPPEGSIARAYYDVGLPVERANNDRIAGAARFSRLLTGIHVGHDPRDGFGVNCSRWCRPGIVIYETCINLIRTLPGLVRAKTRPEDVDTAGEDHWYDAGRYLLALLESLDPPPPGPPGSPPPPKAPRPDREALKGHTTGRTIFGGLRKKQGF